MIIRLALGTRLKLLVAVARIVKAMDETAIIKTIIDGDMQAYEQLVQRYHVGLIIHCERLVHDRQTAEDLTQEAFIKAFERLSTFDTTKSRFSTWLYRIATNKAIDYLRSQKQTIPTEDIELLVDEASPDYEAAEQAQSIRNTVAALQPPTHRQVVEAYYWEGKSYQEIADVMNIPVNTVRTWLRRAKQQLRKELS
jgi:RNA polymerase sigma-70 factor (ECF subfamily)